MIKVSVLGATGYAGIELVRLLHNHPQVELVHLVSHSFAGQPLSDIYPNFKGKLEKICAEMNIEQAASDSDILFTALPHGTSEQIIPALYEKGKKVIDLSGDFRYNSVEMYEKWYGVKHSRPDLLQKSVYGLPELYREKVKTASLVGNPGCYTTCSILALAPLAANGCIDMDTIIIDSKSGASGAGRNPSLDLHFCEVHENMKAYKVASHRHTSEIEQELGLLAGRDIVLSFTPHLLPIKRGILSTAYASLSGHYTFDDIYDIYQEFYSDEPFIVIYDNGSLPEIKNVNGSNSCHIGFVIDQRLNRIIVISVLDNLIKGAGGQAIQNMNLMFGMEETLGLTQPGWYL
jgi:N-acetyl-gamma-glutamyl-phosphate reductase